MFRIDLRKKINMSLSISHIVKVAKSIRVLFGIEGQAALDRNPAPGYNTLLLQLIPGHPNSAHLHRQSHPLPCPLHIGLPCQTPT